MKEVKTVQKEGEEQLWLALEICDSGFPGGAFAHSLGLESAKNHGFVSESRDSLKSFVLLSDIPDPTSSKICPTVYFLFTQ